MVTVKGILLFLLTLSLPPILYAQESAYLLELYGPIDRFQAIQVQRAVEAAREAGTSVLVIDIDTFGGRVDSALEIANALGSADSVKTVTYVGASPEGRGVSWSAGALIALASNEIYLAPGTSIGAATPVIQGPEGEQTASEKTVSAVRGQMAALAERNGHPPAVARAMVDPAVELLSAEVDGERRLITRQELEAIESEGEREIGSTEVISEAGKLLTFTAGEMERYGISKGSPVNRQELASLLGVSGFNTITPSGTDRLVALLTGPGFTSLLILVGLVALFIEITSPGFGLPGAIALTAFSALFASNMMLGRAGSLEIILFVLGLGLLIFEIFVIPGFGVAGISGLFSITVALILSLQRFILPEFDYQWDILGRNLLVVFSSVVGALLIAALLAITAKQTRLFSRLTLTTTQEATAGYTVQEHAASEGYVAREGVTETPLRPAGKVRLGQEVLAAESEGGYVDSGRRVKVVRVDGNRVVVREL
ncbi:MAG: NfeD family protein [Alkalispirochaetaceae bacterium]